MKKSKRKLKKLNREIARNVVSFDVFEDNEHQSICMVKIGGIEEVKTYALKGMEKEVLNEMAYVFWSLKDAIGVN
jgi:hypothetical protein